MNKVGIIMGIVLWIVVVTQFTVMLGLEATNETATALMDFGVADDRSGMFRTVISMVGALLALFSFSLPIPAVINTIVIVPMVAGVVIIVLDIVKHLVPFT